MSAPTTVTVPARFCVDCAHHKSIPSVTGGGNVTHQCTAVQDPITGIFLRQQCAEVRLAFGGECGREGRLFTPKESK